MRHQTGVSLVEAAIEIAQHPYPYFDVMSLSAANLTLCSDGQIAHIAVLDPDQIRFSQCEVQMKFDQRGKRLRGIGRVSDDGLGARQQSRADADEQFDQESFLIGKVAVDRGPADAGRRTDIFQSYGEETALGDEPLGRLQQL
jgi:hypothetical protein